MHSQSHAVKRLVALYRRLIIRLRQYEREAQLAMNQVVFMRVHVEALQSRIMMSVAPGFGHATISLAPHTPSIQVMQKALHAAILTASPNIAVSGPGITEVKAIVSQFPNIVPASSTNNAPVLAGANSLNAINENPTNNPGTSVSAILSGQVTDADLGALSGMAVTAVDDTNGIWQYSTNSGGTWTAFSSLSQTSAMLLAANGSTSVRFVPTTNWSGIDSAGLTFQAWDQTSGTVGTSADVSTNGGSTAFSSSSASAGITVNYVNQPPTVAFAASASAPSTTLTASLSVLGADDGGESHLTYTWNSSGPGPVAFSPNGNHGAQNTIATFSKAGTYTLTAQIKDAGGLSVTSSTTVTVTQVATSATMTPTSWAMNENQQKQFVETELDQFGNPMTQPNFTWSSTGVGAVSSSGLYTSPGAGMSGSATVTATYGSLTSTATITVTDAAPTVAHNANSQGGDVHGMTATLSVLGADDGYEQNLTYTWTSTGPAPVTFSANGTNVAKNVTATFTALGSYSFLVTITDVEGLSVTSSVNVNVRQQATTVIVSPATATVPANQFKQFGATVYDQFGAVLPNQPDINWSVTAGVGVVTDSGLYLASAGAGSAVVTATAGQISSSCNVTLSSPGPVDVPSTGQTTVATNSSGGNPQLPAVAMDENGNFVVAWFDSSNSGNFDAQLYNAAGNPVGGAFQVNAVATGASTAPAVAMDDSGQFVISWQGANHSLFAQLYNSAGTALGGNILITSNLSGSSPPAVAMAADGSFAVAYEGKGTQGDNIYYQNYNAGGTLTAGPLTANTPVQDNQIQPSIATDPFGNRVLAWVDQQSLEIQALLMPASGSAPSPFVVGNVANADTGSQIETGMDASGNFVIAWAGTVSGQGPGASAIYARRYSASGAARDSGPELVSSFNTVSQSEPDVAMRADGSYLITWIAGNDLDGNRNGVFGQAFNADGTLNGAEFLVNSTTQGNQQDSATVWHGTHAVVAWDGNGPANATGIYLQQYATPQGVNQPPVILVPAAQSTAFNTPLTFSSAIGNAITVNDADANGGVEQVTIQATHGVISLATTANITTTAGSGTNDATVTFTGTLANLDAAMNGMIFAPTPGHSGSDANIQIIANDLGNTGSGGAQSGQSAVGITIQPEPGTITVPPGQSTIENVPLTFSSASGNAISINNAWNYLELDVTSGMLTLSQTTGLTFSSGNGTGNSTMAFGGTATAINAALNGMVFTPTNNYTGSTSLVVTASSAGLLGLGIFGSSASSSVGVMVSPPPIPPNQPPAVVIPAAQTNSFNTPVTLSGANAISVSDVDSGGNVEEVSLVANNGTITLATTAQLRFTRGDGAGDGSMDFTGTIASINAALNGLAFTPTTNFIGNGTLTVSINDLGNSGTGGALSASASLNIKVLPPFAVSTTSDIVDGDTSSISALLNNPGADGLISLREAITAANNTPGSHEIDFKIAGGGAQTISVTSALPQITNSLTIDATTEPGYSGSPLVELNGQGAPFGAIGLAVAASNTTIRGLAIYGFSGNGIDVLPVGANNITIQSNYVGINAAGTAIYNGTGVVLANSSNDLVGGAAASLRNVISGNYSYGVHIFGSGSSSDVIAGNYIGTNPAGTAAIPNGNTGVFVDGASGDTIGLSTAGGGNVISGNTSVTNGVDGILINAGSGNTVQGNEIGTDAAGTTVLGNKHDGIEIVSSSNNIIGGTAAGAGNLIAYNAKGVVVSGTGASGNAVRGNAIFGNNVIGIDLADDGITANAGALNVANPNDGMNFPVFTSVALTGNTLAVSGYVGSSANQSAFAGAIIDLFKSDLAESNGQGQVYLGSVTADASGNFNATLTVAGLVLGDQISGTATDTAGDTSEFAGNALVQLVNAPPQITRPPATQSLGENSGLVFSQAGGNAISVYDPDAHGAAEEMTLSISGGTLTLSETSGLSFQASTSNGTGTLDVIGTLENLNAAVNGMVFSPALDFSGSLSLNISMNDLGHTGAGPAQTAGSSVNLGVSPVQYTPAVTSASTIINTQTTSGLVITPDPRDGASLGYYQISNITGGTLYLNDGQTPISNGQFITFAQGAAGLKFTPATNSQANGNFTLRASSTTAVNGLTGARVTATIALIPTAHTPTVTVSVTTENQQTASGLVIRPNDVDASTRVWFQITNIQGGTLYLSDGTTRISGGDFISAAQGLAGLKFTPAADSVSPGSFNVQASTSSDVSGLGGGVATAVISVTPIPPVNSVPTAQSGTQDTSLVFSTGNGNAIVISDPGSVGSNEQVTLSAAHGTLTLASTAGVTLVSGTGAGDASVTLAGSISSINAALNGMTFAPASGYFGPAAIRVVTQDLAIGASASSNVAINLAPTTLPPAQTPPQLNVLPPVSAPVLYVPTAPATYVPAIDNSSSPAAGVIDSGGESPATSGSTTSASSTSSSGSTASKSAPMAIVNPVASAVAPVLARSVNAREMVDVTSVPALARLADVASPTADALTLSPGERLTSELAALRSEGVLHSGNVMAIKHYNPANPGVNAAGTLYTNTSLWRDLDKMEEQMTSEKKMHAVAGVASLASVGVSVMYFMWAVRAGSVLSSLLSSMPAWKLVDPLPILDQMAGSRAGRKAREEEEDGETLESMVEGEGEPA